MKNILLLFILFCTNKAFAQVTLKGYIHDETGNGVLHAKIHSAGMSNGKPTGQDGYFELKLPIDNPIGSTVRIFVEADGYAALELDQTVSEIPIIYRLKFIRKGHAGSSQNKQFTHKPPSHHPSSPHFALGQHYQGGVIFYLQDDKLHGWIASEDDLGIDVPWMIHGDSIAPGSYSTLDGFSNCQNIIAQQGDSGRYAAKICRDYRGGGFKDWFLPGQDQLRQLYINRKSVGNLKPTFYWSSTGNGNNVGIFNFNDGSSGVDFNYGRHPVRAVRAF